MEIVMWVSYVTLEVLLASILYVGIPSYLAIKAVKILFPSLKGAQLPFLEWRDFGLFFIILILSVPLRLLLVRLGVGTSLEIPIWVLWDLDSLVPAAYHRVGYFPPIAMFIAKIISILYFDKRDARKINAGKAERPANSVS